MSLDLATRHVLVIGGSGTIGSAVVRLAASMGATVTGTSIDDRFPDVDGTDWRVLDVTDDGPVTDLLRELAGETPVTDIVVAGAARPFASLAEMPGEDLTALVDTKLWGAFHVGRAAGEHLPADGTLTYISGLLAAYPDAASPVAAVSAAVEALARGLAVELAPIRVNCVSPDPLGSPGRGDHAGAPADVAEAILSLVTNEWMSGTVLEIHGAGKP